ncbi:hypothetical protein [Streptomyces sp. NPDC052042]|uniref:hypothetical protein n=1 Tax=Streptomyces sp. NPDC052042 TaxID=3365683 RepID=UPI0037D27769
MSADVTGLLASIDDVLAAVETAPSPPPSPPPAPSPTPVPASFRGSSDTADAPAEPVVVAAQPIERPGGRGDWWDSLYGTPEAGAEAPEPLAPAPHVSPTPRAEATKSPAARVSRTPRLPYWWEQKKPVPERPVQPERPELEKAGTPDPKQAGPTEGTGTCAHDALLALRAEGDHGEVVARLCLDCDERLPATDPEPEAECEHEERLEARSESGTLIGYVCAAEGCGTRLSVEEVHGRVGKWLRPAATYYPRPRNPFSPAEGEEAKPALSAGTLRLLANAGAAGVGYWLGLVPLIGYAIEECGRTTSIGGALTLGFGVVLFVAHVWDRKTRHWNPLLAWVARIPLASAITALALYAPASQI